MYQGSGGLRQCEPRASLPKPVRGLLEYGITRGSDLGLQAQDLELGAWDFGLGTGIQWLRCILPQTYNLRLDATGLGPGNGLAACLMLSLTS